MSAYDSSGAFSTFITLTSGSASFCSTPTTLLVWHTVKTHASTGHRYHHHHPVTLLFSSTVQPGSSWSRSTNDMMLTYISGPALTDTMAWFSSIISSKEPSAIGAPRMSSTFVRSSCEKKPPAIQSILQIQKRNEKRANLLSLLMHMTSDRLLLADELFFHQEIITNALLLQKTKLATCMWSDWYRLS
jgi:hypothetical protein